MKQYEVTIRATITKTYTVKGRTEEAAISAAYYHFTVLQDGTPEKYEDEVVSITPKE